jgi:hypothetical protein
MNWFYAEGNQQAGPVSDSQLDEFLRSGKISPATLVWHEGMPQWQPLGIARPMANVCVECGKTFPPEELIQLNNSPVCAQCKPILLQRMMEGAATPSFGSLWRMNNRLVTRNETVFPDRCVKCNAPAGGSRLKRTLYWMHPAWLLLFFVSGLILIIIYYIIRKKAVLHIGLCEHHRSQRKLGIITGWSSFALGILLFVLAGIYNSGWCALAGIVVFLGGIIAGVVMARLVTPTKIDNQYVWLSGVHRDFLASLPEWQGK